MGRDWERVREVGCEPSQRMSEQETSLKNPRIVFQAMKVRRTGAASIRFWTILL